MNRVEFEANVPQQLALGIETEGEQLATSENGNLKPVAASSQVNAPTGPKVLPMRLRSPPAKMAGCSRRIALRNILRAVNVELENAGITLGDGATQDLISTLWISSAKEGFVGWEPEGGQNAA